MLRSVASGTAREAKDILSSLTAASDGVIWADDGQESIDSPVGLVPRNALVFTDSLSLAWLVALPDKFVLQPTFTVTAFYLEHRLFSSGQQEGAIRHRLERECRFAGYYRNE